MCADWSSWGDSMENDGAHHCGIYDRQGNPWTSKNVSFSSEEIKELERVISTKKQDVFCSGLLLNGERWTPVILEDDLLVVKGKDESNKAKTMTCCLSKSAVVIGANKDSSVDGRTVRGVIERVKCNLSDANL